MGIFKNCLLVSDIDGTLYNGSIPQRNMEALEYFKSEGGVFSVATGRGPTIGTEICKRAGVNAPVLMCNGSVIYDVLKSEIIYADYLTDNEKQLTYDVLKEYPSLGVEITLPDCLSTIFKEGEDGEKKVDGISFTKFSKSELMAKDWLKVLLMSGEKSVLDGAKEYLKLHKTDGCDYIVTTPTFYDIVPKGTNKSVNIHRLADFCKVPYDKIFCIGDYYNDLEMIELAAVGAAVTTAPDDVKAKADYITCDVKGGAVADFIYYLANKQKG